jgi:hypothetical protein
MPSPSPSPEASSSPSPSPTASPIPAATVGDSDDGGVPGGIWVALGFGVIAAAGAAAYLYLRNREGPPA